MRDLQVVQLILSTVANLMLFKSFLVRAANVLNRYPQNVLFWSFTMWITSECLLSTVGYTMLTISIS
ncbi:hypothetical protein J2S17_002840 [Cytobacillus purgationiresistens]|uniref:Uncharacterized protein n=1 Tax=Cytobacillus purgationiresistens TaxID=863449 RepID=A0ABU0AI74_9BACI|nr:hypothetical protein [Cytobacillus purgationiresistens]